jgi:hypothetical protein
MSSAQMLQAQPTHPTSHSPTNRERVLQLILLSDGLADIIDQEVELLTTRRPSELAQFEEEKTRLAKLYADEMGRFRNDRSLTKGVPAGLLEDLKTSTARLQGKLDAQSGMLTGMRSVSERMIQKIAQEVSRTRNPQRTYGSNANFAPAAGGGALAFAVNRTA